MRSGHEAGKARGGQLAGQSRGQLSGRRILENEEHLVPRGAMEGTSRGGGARPCSGRWRETTISVGPRLFLPALCRLPKEFPQ
jgi:hypothetical protein